MSRNCLQSSAVLMAKTFVAPDSGVVAAGSGTVVVAGTRMPLASFVQPAERLKSGLSWVASVEVVCSTGTALPSTTFQFFSPSFSASSLPESEPTLFHSERMVILGKALSPD